MKVISLQSGSNGNCIYVEAGGARLLFDAGISGKQVEERLAASGRDAREIDAVLVSHDHSDHCRSLGVLHRKFGLEVHGTQPTLDEAESRYRLGDLGEVSYFAAGDRIAFGKVTVETIPTPHDGVDGVGFVIDDGQRRLGILTDLGHVFAGLEAVIASLDAVLLESNYDEAMLDNGPYPIWLRRRIRGSGGHLSNLEAAELLLKAAGPRLQWACLGHLSHENNTAEAALATHADLLRGRFPLHLATRYEATDIMEL